MSKHGLDKFYTKEPVVDWCLSNIDIYKYSIIIEPSVGSGAFYNKIKHNNKIGIDISPEIYGENIIKQDFLLWEPESFWLNEQILVIGNPPFGRNGSLAIKFIKKAANYNADIAFILPRGFKKKSMYDKIPMNYIKTFEEDLPSNSFTYNGTDYEVPCVFQIYEKSKHIRTPYPKKIPKYFQFVKKEYANISIRRVGVNAGDVYYELDVSPSSHYFIYSDYADLIYNNVSRVNFSFNDTTGPRSISKNDLIDVIDDVVYNHIHTKSTSRLQL
jgi:hypothetical protein